MEGKVMLHDGTSLTIGLAAGKEEKKEEVPKSKSGSGSQTVTVKIAESAAGRTNTGRTWWYGMLIILAMALEPL